MEENARTQILITAEKLFGEKDFEGTSIRELAREAGVNVAMVSYYFGSKEKLFEEMVNTRILKGREKIRELKNSEGSNWEKIEKLIEHFVGHFLSSCNFHKILHRELSLRNRPEMTERISANMVGNMQEFAGIIRQGIKQGEFRKVDVELTLSSVYGSIFHILNSEELSRHMLGASKDPKNRFDAKQIERVKTHMKDLLSAHLHKR